MSVVYPDPSQDQTVQGVPQASRPNIIEEHPYIAIGLGLVIVFLVLFLLGKRNEQSTTGQQSSVNGIPASGDTSGLQRDANGNPIEFVPTQNEFMTYSSTSDSNNVSNSNNQTSTNTTNNTTTTTNNPPGPPVHPIMCGVGLHWDAVQGRCVPNTLPGPGPVPGPPPPPTPAPPTPAPPPTTHKTYTVTHWPLPGSSLWSIATIEYGNPMKWPDIYNANKATIGNNPNLIRQGMVLNIP